MPKIVVINNATEQMLGQRLTVSQAGFAAKAALRNIWLAYAGDIAVSSAEITAEFLSYVSKIASFTREAGVPEFVRADTDGVTNVVLQDRYLLRANFIESLRARITDPQNWSLLACYQTAGTANLQAKLGLATSRGEEIGRNFSEFMGTNLLNRKSHFRQLAAGCRLPLADGRLVTSASSLLEAVDSLIPVTGKVIVKQDNGAGGTGNCILTANISDPLPGAYASIALPQERQAVKNELAEMWKQWQDLSPGPMVAEVYHSATAMFYLEFLIDADGRAHFMNTGAIRVRPHDDPLVKELFWVGLELPAKLPPATLAAALVHCHALLRLAAAMGYRGHVNIDAITTEEGELLFNEINARWGGGTVLHDLATRLVGPNFVDTHVAASFRDVRSPGFGKLVEVLEKHHMAFDPRTKEGIVVLACDDQHSGTFEALILARSSDRARMFEQRLVEVLESLGG
ncbi:hypothetical protein RLEG3_03970 (plasmid) [Rhizobium leguminosarum bv. trifolii WSM1689]|uniref:preATP grasp domain-containing protein n=1 Tax=Rhizobium leguminosarum TaxID=384 RepID=UPI0003E0A613|nr:peptide ligase PGM1-related protein [Rhizobium leguminosarum]AHF88262.1 hypothetical protein RLEG3_03970 [Rhizobium leguminosarum bv. trifolii WSM1689]